MTITQERLASLRKMARSDGQSPPTAAELLDACEALLEENERLAQENDGWARLHTHTAYREGFEACQEKAANLAREPRFLRDTSMLASNPAQNSGVRNLGLAIRALTPEEPT
jgi:predicted urease superfamily metal-dependent hydrolase